MKSELNLFGVPSTQTSIDHGTTVIYHSIANIVDAGLIEFDIPAPGKDYLVFTNTYLHLGARIVQTEGTATAAYAVVGSTNLLLHSLFSQVEVFLNDKLISSSSNTYAYRAYLKTLLNYGKAAKESQLTASLWYKDTTNHMNETSMADDGKTED